MKKSLVLAMAMALGVTASAYAANPFSDVPAGHWAYDSVAKLAAAGVVDGYTDGAFAGDKLITRYEMAQIVAKAMAKGADCDKLAAEFADELDTLGVRVAKLEKGADAVKIAGNIRYHYAANDGDLKGNANNLRSRIWINGQVNDDWSYTSMLEHNENFDNDAAEETVKFQRAYVNGKLGGFKVQAGRYDNKIMDGNIYHSRFDGVQLDYGKDVKVRLAYGKATPSTPAHATAGDVAYAEVYGKVGVVSLAAGYYDSNDETAWDGTKTGTTKNFKAIDDNKIWALNATMPLAKDVKVGAMYLKADLDEALGYTDLDDDGYIFTVSYKGAKASVPGSWGFEAKYYDQGTTTYMDHTMNGKADDLAGFKGWGLFANYALAKNIVAQVEYYDLEEKEGLKRDAETLWTQVVFTF